jgi:excisionase family DNA binding protein
MEGNIADGRAYTEPQRLVGPDEVAVFLGVPLRTVYRWRSRREGPPGYRVGRHVRYRVEDVELWLAEHRDPEPELRDGPANQGLRRLTATPSPVSTRRRGGQH